ncbi:MAG TPA: AP2 domain-containing protein [Pyrinomonadaceae bacterium]
MKVIPITKGQVVFVDDEDYAALTRWKWHRSSHGYVVRTPGGRKSREIIFMHRQIMNAPAAAAVIFLDGNPLNCRKENLLIVGPAGIQHKRGRLETKTSSRYKGVFRHKGRRKWFARIKVAGRAMHLGSFGSEEAAARAYDEAARRFFGEHAFLNFKPTEPGI